MQHVFFLLILSALFFSGCSSDKLDVDVSSIDYDLEIHRFEQRMFDARDPEEMSALNQEILDVGGELYEFYVFEMLRSGSVYDDSIGDYLFYFVEDSIMKIAKDDIDKEFANFEEQIKKIEDAFKHLKFHLPEVDLPDQLITYNSAFNYGVISTDHQIGIGLEMYLGAENSIV